MTYLLRLILGLWACTFIATSFASSGLLHPQCAASLEFEIESLYSRRNFRLYDFYIGLSYYHSEPLKTRRRLTPTKTTKYQIKIFSKKETTTMDKTLNVQQLIYLIIQIEIFFLLKRRIILIIIPKIKNGIIDIITIVRVLLTRLILD
jgi:hypothetical protein